MRIFINPGHAPEGRPDPGACGWYQGKQVRECDVVKQIGFAAAQYLEDVGLEVMVFQNDSLYSICKKANDWQADLFVSIHINAGGGIGTETFCYEPGGCSGWLAQCVQRQIVDALDMVDRGVKFYGYYVLAHTKMPAVLVEAGFVDSADDVQKLVEQQDDFARAIARGVTDYICWMGD